MSKFGISLAEKPLLNYLVDGGRVEHQECIKLILRFIAEATTDPEVVEVCKSYDLTGKDLFSLYFEILQNSYPHSVLNSGGPLLLPTLIFMEPFRLASAARLIKINEKENKTHDEAITETAKSIAENTWNSHYSAGQTLEFGKLKKSKQSRKSCAVWIIAGILTILVAVIFRACAG